MPTPTKTPTKTIDHYLSTAHEIADKVRTMGAEIDEQRRIPVEVSDEMADRGFFRLLLPKSLGGAELEHPGLSPHCPRLRRGRRQRGLVREPEQRIFYQRGSRSPRHRR